MAATSVLQRLIRNTTRLPRRTWSTLRRQFDANYDLERQAKSLDGWFPPDHLARLEAIPGMCSARVCRLVALLASQAPAGGAILEIGAWKGRITAWLVEAAERRPERPPVISIDPHARESWADFCRTVEEFRLAERGLQVIRERSRDAARGWSCPISMLWIDGSHEYDDVARDIADYAPHVVAGGYVAFDDSVGGAFPGVERAIAEWRAADKRIVHVATLRNITVLARQA